MIVKIQVRRDTGAFQYRDANVGEFARAAIDRIECDGKGGNVRDGWWWLKQYLCYLCISRMEQNVMSVEVADRWYRRYQKLREIE